MAYHETTSPVGLDAVIGVLQRALFIDLSKVFGWRNYDSYPRAYRNRKGEDKIPEVYCDGDYKEMLFNDKQTVTSYFLADENRSFDEVKGFYTQGVSIIFQADLKALFPDIKHRADEELIDNIRQSIRRRSYDNMLDSVFTGVDKVYDGLKISYDKKYFDDMNNFCIVRFYLKMTYTNPVNKSNGKFKTVSSRV